MERPCRVSLQECIIMLETIIFHSDNTLSSSDSHCKSSFEVNAARLKRDWDQIHHNNLREHNLAISVQVPRGCYMTCHKCYIGISPEVC